ncbi:MAG: DUF2007 domain-containing protein [Gelidibacter sp.]
MEEEEEFIKVFSGTFIIVQLAMDRLESAGIHAIVKDESGLGQHSGFTSANSGYQELYVSKEELDHAIPIIEAVKSDLEV